MRLVGGWRARGSIRLCRSRKGRGGVRQSGRRQRAEGKGVSWEDNGQG